MCQGPEPALWALSSWYLALVDGSMLGSTCEDTRGKEMAELSPGLEGDRETWPGKEQGLNITDSKRRKKDGLYVRANVWFLIHVDIFVSDIGSNTGLITYFVVMLD